jgi:serine/threonine-protein kinase HipA
VLIALAGCVSDFESEIVEYARRDLLNLALGNRDNHGRNTAVLKDVDGTLRLAPLYDFGPSFLDARAIVRVIHWDGEDPGRRDWNHILENLSTRFEEANVPVAHGRALADAMRAFAPDLDELPTLMSACDVSPRIIELRRGEIARLADELRAIKEMS